MKLFKNLLLIAAVSCGANSASAQTWTQTSAPTTNWFSITCSADGTKVAAVNQIPPDPWLYPASPVYLSTNSGTTWTPVDPDNITGSSLSWDYIASSADGTKLIASAADGPLFISADSGLDWTNIETFNSLDYAGWAGLNSLADGSKFFGVDGAIYVVSMDSGNTWTSYTPSIGYGYLNCIASSADGTKLVAGSFYNSVYTSTNSGATWSTTGPAFQLLWGSVASSADGRKLVAAVYASSVVQSNGVDVYFDGPIYTSADSGNTWTMTSAPSNHWQSVASSADGNTLVAAVSSGLIYTSTNSGTTWIPADAPGTNWQDVACSEDGSKLFAVVNGGGIWTAQITPTPQLSVVSTNGNLTLSWLVPSTNFVLQSSADLSSWTDLTNQPTLNLTNLQNEVFLPFSGSGGFYRLKTP